MPSIGVGALSNKELMHAFLLVMDFMQQSISIDKHRARVSVVSLVPLLK